MDDDKDTLTVAEFLASRDEQKKASAVRTADRVKNSRTDKLQKVKVREAAYKRNRVARKREAEGSHTAEDVTRIYKAQGGKCACCRVKVGSFYHVDHIQALSKGGSNWPANLQILCGSCNLKKHATDAITFMQGQGLLL